MVDQLSFNFSAPPPQLPQLWTPDDIFKSAAEATIALFREDNRVERKRWQVDIHDFAAYLSMWANSQPHGGIIFIGIGDDGSILGCKDASAASLNKFETARQMCPDARYELKRVPVTNSHGEPDFIIVARVYYRQDKLVETVKHEAYIREGDQKRRLSEPEKREIRLNKGEVEFESEPVRLVFPDEFDGDLMADFVSSFRQKRNVSLDKSREDILQLAHFGTIKSKRFVPNIACALIFGRDPVSVVPGAYIRILRYDGKFEKTGRALNVISDDVVEGPLPAQLLRAQEVIQARLRQRTLLTEDGRFLRRPEYPTDVWREAITNAVVHRSYNLRSMNIFVKMFDDRLIVESPGTFMPPTTAETVYEAHNPRNPHLMWGMYYFDFVFCAFEGTRRMRAEMRAANLPAPEFLERHAGVFQVVVTLRNGELDAALFAQTDVSTVLSEKQFRELGYEEKFLTTYLAENPSVNVTHAALMIDKDWKTARAVLDRLCDAGIVVRQSGKPRDGNGRYYLKSKVPPPREKRLSKPKPSPEKR